MEFNPALAFMRSEIDGKLKGNAVVPPGYLEEHVNKHSGLGQFLDEKMRERLVRHLETYYGTSQENGHLLKGNFTEWYPERKASIQFYYWRRLQRYWLQHSVLPVGVVKSVDNVTDEILGFLGDPHVETAWARRGLVMGHVQSGKTTNYSALIAKAADAGYRIIIVLAGLTNSLRYQTQVRLDETFVGKSSLGDSLTSEVYPVSRVMIGIDEEDQTIRHPFCGTTQIADFSSNTTRGVGASEGNFRDPILFVTKKHERVLERLADWLVGLNHGRPLKGPMLLIDDEADNASINTAKDPDKTTRINERIRNLLACSNRSSYIGYTATPFANIFIDPDTNDKMINEDLFPRHFIKSLEPPSNYIGAKDLFSSTGRLHSSCIREIPDDYLILLPLKHKSSHPVVGLPPSLLDAVREYVLFRAIRLLSEVSSGSSSMLVNVSRFNAVQQQVHDHIYSFLVSLKEAADAWAGSPLWERSEALATLHSVWQREYADANQKWTWVNILEVLKLAIAPIQPRLVNMQGGGIDYSQASDSGIHVIAIGGLALARGLTLEGLAVSYVLRNVGAADTLMQMGRWFGYRPDYEHLCRIHTTSQMNEDFREISDAVEELRGDLVRMERMGRTPNDFGLKVRQSPSGIAITAKNKMRSAGTHHMAINLSRRHLQGFEVFNNEQIFSQNLDAASRFIESISSKPETSRVEDETAIVWSGVAVSDIKKLLQEFELPSLEFAVIDGGRSLLLDYISDRAFSELSTWDVAIPIKRRSFMKESKLPLPFPGLETFYCRQRFSGVPKQDDIDVVKFLQKNIVADRAPTDLRYGEDYKEIDMLAEQLLENSGSDWSTEKRYVSSRTKPLLVVHSVEFRLDENRSNGVVLNLPAGQPAVTLSLAFPPTSISPVPRVYAASIRLREMLQQAAEQTETDEVDDDDA